MKRAGAGDSRRRVSDRIVGGGGITGAADARDAVLRGRDRLLLEIHSLGKGTTNRSTKRAVHHRATGRRNSSTMCPSCTSATGPQHYRLGGRSTSRSLAVPMCTETVTARECPYSHSTLRHADASETAGASKPNR